MNILAWFINPLKHKYENPCNGRYEKIIVLKICYSTKDALKKIFVKFIILIENFYDAIYLHSGNDKQLINIKYFYYLKPLINMESWK